MLIRTLLAGLTVAAALSLTAESAHAECAATLTPMNGESNFPPTGTLNILTRCAEPKVTLTTESGTAVPFDVTHDTTQGAYQVKPKSNLANGTYILDAGMAGSATCTAVLARSKFTVGPKPAVARFWFNIVDNKLSGVSVYFSEVVAKSSDVLPAAGLVSVEVGGVKLDNCQPYGPGVACQAPAGKAPAFADHPSLHVTVKKTLAFQSGQSLLADFDQTIDVASYTEGWDANGPVSCPFKGDAGGGCSFGGAAGLGSGAALLLLLCVGALRRRR